ncbi:MAG: c-type cytochrome [Acidobacteriia bacterium]|nr:c-type cytochrome [Terriglobia bacterium]
MPLKRLFAASSVLFLVVLAISPVKNALRPYRSFQQRYRQMGIERAKTVKAAREYRERPVRIEQLWLRDLGDRVDRCTTCHVGTTDPLMTDVPEPFRRHPATYHTPRDLKRLGCTSCHGGQGPATVADDAHGTAPDSGPPMTPTPYLESGCGWCHTTASPPEAPVLERGRAVMARAGCFACHRVQGREGFRSDAPSLTTLPLKTGGEWLRQWLKGPRDVDPNTPMPDFHLADEEINDLSHYLFGQAVPRDLTDRVVTASREPAGEAANGKKIFSESRCISCHTVEGKGNGSAPELSKVASWAARGWLLAFVRDPRAFYPRTRMPQYHFSEVESRDLVAYMEEELKDFNAPPNLLEPLPVNRTRAEAGEKLFRRYGCFACHAGGGAAESEEVGPELTAIGDKRASSLDFGLRHDVSRDLPDWLAAKIESPRSFAPNLKMPSFDFNADDTRAVVTALLSFRAEPVAEGYRPAAHAPIAMVPGGEVGRLIDRYRCLSCHQIGALGGDLSTAPLTREGSKVKKEWLLDYLMLPYSIRPILEERMPNLRIPREDALALANAVDAFYVDPGIPDDPFRDRPVSDADPAEGERLYVTLGCRACHITGSSGGYYGPPLTDTAKRLKPGWLYVWLKGPQRWRADVRCPDYGLSDTDALRLTSYLGTLVAPPAPASPVAKGGAR